MRSRVAVATAAAVLLLAGAYAVSRCRQPGRPNIVVIVWDTCRADRVSALGYARPTTPRLAAFASQGVTFRRCFSPSPWTPPAHASLFTGLLPRRHGLREGVSDRVHHGIPLLAETLRADGYDAVAVVGNPYISTITGLGQGFDPLYVVFDPKTGKGTGTEAVRQVESWLARRRAEKADARPLFLFVNLMDSHIPYTYRPESAAALGLDGLDVLDAAARDAAVAFDHDAALRHITGFEPASPAVLAGVGPVYDAAVHSTDRATGEILDLLEAEGILADAFVAVTGDHGENLGEGGRLDHVMSVHEATLHVPLVVRWPGRLDGGRIEEAQVRLQDLYPTILDAAGAEAPEVCGRDARSLLESPLSPRVAVAEFGPNKANLAVVGDLFRGKSPDLFFLSFLAVRDPAGRKYVETVFHPDDRPPAVRSECLFDVVADPGEARCLLDENASPELRAEAERFRELGK